MVSYTIIPRFIQAPPCVKNSSKSTAPRSNRNSPDWQKRSIAMKQYVLDANALLALFLAEPGADQV